MVAPNAAMDAWIKRAVMRGPGGQAQQKSRRRQKRRSKENIGEEDVSQGKEENQNSSKIGARRRSPQVDPRECSLPLKRLETRSRWEHAGTSDASDGHVGITNNSGRSSNRTDGSTAVREGGAGRQRTSFRHSGEGFQHAEEEVSLGGTTQCEVTMLLLDLRHCGGACKQRGFHLPRTWSSMRKVLFQIR